MAPKQKSRFNFDYQTRDDEEVRKMARETGRKYENPYKPGFDVFIPKADTNNIRILPPSWPNPKHYGYTIYVHRYVGAAGATFLCLNMMDKGKCPCCEAWKEAKESGDDDEARKMSYSVQMVYWIIDRNGEDDTPQLYTISKVRDSEIIELSEDPQTHKLLKIDHPDDGYDISFKRTGKGKTDTKYIGTRVARSPSPIHPDEDTQDSILEFITKHPIPSVLQFRDYKFINDAISGTAEEKDEDLDQPEERPSREERTSSRTRPTARHEEPKEESEEAPFEEDEPPARTARTESSPRRAARTPVVEEDEEEEESNVQEPPTARRHKPEPRRTRG